MPVSWGLFPPDQPCTRFLCIQEMEEQKDPRVTYLRISGGLAKARKGSWRSAGAPSLSQLSTTTAIPSSLHKFTAALLRLSPRIHAELPPRNPKLMSVFILFAFHYDESGVGMILSSLMKAQNQPLTCNLLNRQCSTRQFPDAFVEYTGCSFSNLVQRLN